MSRRPDSYSTARYLDRRQAAEFLGVSTHWLTKYANDPRTPPYVTLGRKTWYRRGDLERWRAARRKGAKTDETGKRTRMIPEPRESDLDAAFEQLLGEDAMKETEQEAIHDEKTQEFLNQLRRFLGELTDEKREEWHRMVDKLFGRE